MKTNGLLHLRPRRNEGPICKRHQASFLPPLCSPRQNSGSGHPRGSFPAPETVPFRPAGVTPTPTPGPQDVLAPFQGLTSLQEPSALCKRCVWFATSGTITSSSEEAAAPQRPGSQAKVPSLTLPTVSQTQGSYWPSHSWRGEVGSPGESVRGLIFPARCHPATPILGSASRIAFFCNNT